MWFVRAFDEKLNKYYKSFKYALINAGYYEQAILFNPYSNCFELVDYLDKTTSDLKPLYEHIFYDEDENVLDLTDNKLSELRKYCQWHGYNGKLDFFTAIKEIAENFEFIALILKDGSVCKDKTTIKSKNLIDGDWKYIQTKQAADELMDFYYGFHDSEIMNLNFQPKFNNNNALLVKFNNGNNEIELCFEGLITLHLTPAAEKYSNEIFCATLEVIDEKIFWADAGLMEGEVDDVRDDDKYPDDLTYIEALSLKWRIIK